MPIHLRAEPGDYAPNVLCPGDPVRAQYIAETFFDPGFKQVNEVRGMLGFTGTFEGKPLSVQTTGMGAPSAGIVFDELAQLGAKRLVRVGTCGGLADDMSMGDTVIALTAAADDHAPRQLSQMDGIVPTATFSLVEEAARLTREGSMGKVHIGPIVTSGLFYEPNWEKFNTWKALGHLAVEMEAAMMYVVGAMKGMEALALMTVSDMIGEGDGDTVRISDEDMKRGVDQMMEIGCRVAVSG
ncbi:phosphorylase family protein [Ilumatobacter coccineus]|jgi:purine-nucleoside phosphorylase|uniref:Uridine phosphorylase n=1 Tax=Ilumatobacter coccineus (strain NBRC 103263 / KCTC 29153 / YM16-304) TaxID=1313172 RepID=A0A6C7E795_ILUCY|nr:purine-nucleoside phosphorylase [Ilumatobacter coccineus]BAN01045.1 purine nucleoside phosphorylase [Ilumatobacter coccineus YM16-304]